jgi:hypothetical protein
VISLRNTAVAVAVSAFGVILWRMFVLPPYSHLRKLVVWIVRGWLRAMALERLPPQWLKSARAKFQRGLIPPPTERNS